MVGSACLAKVGGCSLGCFRISTSSQRPDDVEAVEGNHSTHSVYIIAMAPSPSSSGGTTSVQVGAYKPR